MRVLRGVVVALALGCAVTTPIVPPAYSADRSSGGPSATDPDPDVSWSGIANDADGSVRVGGAEDRQTKVLAPVTSGGAAAAVLLERRMRALCTGNGAGTAPEDPLCDPVVCDLPEGRSGLRRSFEVRRVLAETREPISQWEVERIACIGEPAPAGPSLDREVLRAFRDMALPGLAVRTDPPGAVFVRYRTLFTAVPGWTQAPLGQILGRPVRLEITPIRYRWSFGDGATAASPLPRARHSYLRQGDMAVWVATTYRARYSVSGGPARAIPGTVTVTGPGTALAVEQTRSQLVAGPGLRRLRHAGCSRSWSAPQSMARGRSASACRSSSSASMVSAATSATPTGSFAAAEGNGRSGWMTWA